MRSFYAQTCITNVLITSTKTSIMKGQYFVNYCSQDIKQKNLFAVNGGRFDKSRDERRQTENHFHVQFHIFPQEAYLFSLKSG